MSNTIIQIKRSATTAVPPNGSLANGELAISYASNTLFSGNVTGTGIDEIGGKKYVELTKYAAENSNNAFAKANAANVLAYTSSLASNAYAEAVGAAGNSYARTVGTAGNNYTITVGAGSNNWANLVATYANSYAQTVGAAGNSYTQTVGSAGNTYAQTVGAAANTYANNTFLKLSGGTVSGDLVVTGNATFSGTTTYANTQTLLIGDNILTLNADLPGAVAPSENAGLEVNRGSSANVFLRWNEGVDLWQFTNNGTNYLNIASNTDVEGARTLAIDSAAGANAYARTVGTAGNNYTNTVGTAGNSYTQTVGTAGNNYTITVGAASNNWANLVATYANGYAQTVGTAGNSYARTVGTAGNNYTITVGAASNNWANLVASYANTYAESLASGASANAANGSYISTGIVKVPFGGTGVTSFTQNGILFGNTSGDLKVTSAGTEGQVLQASSSGIPLFAMLDGGAF